MLYITINDSRSATIADLYSTDLLNKASSVKVSRPIIDVWILILKLFFYKINTACNMNVHKRCQKNVANNCGINTKEMAEILNAIGVNTKINQRKKKVGTWNERTIALLNGIL